jgi:drug/metabolite transporter (DMT)-like permease
MQSLWMIAASLLFACMGVCVKLGAAQFAAAELVFWRGFIATLLIGSYVLLRRLPLATPHVRTHVVRGVSGFVSLVMYFYAISMIPLAAAVTLNYTSPLFLALLLVLWVREPVRRGFYAVLAAGFIGVILLLQPTLAREQWLGAMFGGDTFLYTGKVVNLPPDPLSCPIPRSTRCSYESCWLPR